MHFMATILAIDTSTHACSVALSMGGKTVEDFQVIPQSHTHCLLPMIDGLLAQHQISLTALDAIALTIGPGSFTGLRIGLGIVQGLAFGADKPVIAESSLAVMALGAKRLLQVPENTYLMPSFDARMQEVYWACYQCDASGNDVSIKTVAEDAVASPQTLLAAAKQISGSVLGVGDGWNCLDKVSLNDLNVVSGFYPHAYDVAVLAQKAYAEKRLQSALEVQPVYIRNQVSWKKRQKIRGSTPSDSKA
jgi:tRNA threonylcarbamoyladenosine biosynthesis protein TsaB